MALSFVVPPTDHTIAQQDAAVTAAPGHHAGLLATHRVAVSVAYMTEHDALITNARLQAGESVLVHAASSSVGVAAIQIARLWGAKPVMGTSGVNEKLAALAAQGLDQGINIGGIRLAADHAPFPLYQHQ